MKTLLIALLMLSQTSFAQQIYLKPDSITTKYTYSEVINFDSSNGLSYVFDNIILWANSTTSLVDLPMNKDKIAFFEYSENKRTAYFAAKDESSRQAPKVIMSSKDQQKIILQGICKYQNGSCLMACYTRYQITIQLKLGRMKVTFSDYTMDINSDTDFGKFDGKQSTLENWMRSGAYKETKRCENVTADYSIYIQKKSFDALVSLRSFMQQLSASKKSSEDW